MRLKTVLDHSDQAISSVDRDRRLVAFNSILEEIMQRIYGVQLTQGMDLGAFLPPGEASFWNDAYDRAFAGEQFSVERPYDTPAGRSIIQFSFNPIRSGDEIESVAVFGKDVTATWEESRQLVTSEAQYRMLFESSPLAMWVIDPETLRILKVNPATCRQYGYSLEEFTSLTIWDIRPPSERERLKDLLPLMAKEGNSVRGIQLHQKKDGSLIHVDVNSGPIEYHGKPARIALLKDVTAQVRAEQELKEANERFQLASKAVNSMIYDLNLTTGESRRSASLLALLGYDPIAEPETATLTWWQSRIHPEDLAIANGAVIQQFPNGKICEAEYRMLHKDGHWVWVWDRGIVSYDELGTATRLVGATHDITARVKSERDLGQANDRFRLAADAVTAVIYEWNIQTGEFIDTPGLFPLLGFDPNVDLFTRKLDWWLSRIHPEDLPGVREIVKNALRHEKQYEMEYRIQHRDGYYISVWDRGVIERDNRNWAVRVVGSAQDISERKTLEAQLEQERNQALSAKEHAEEMSKLKSSFLANMSHEIRTPMTAILGFAGILAERVTDPELKDYASIIESSSTRLLGTINSILDLAQVESHRVVLSPLMVDVNAEVQRTCALLEPLAARRKLRLRFTPTLQNAMALIDPQQFERVVTNLVGNAIKFTEQGDVTIRILTASDCLENVPAGFHSFKIGDELLSGDFRLVVEDTGLGIAEERLPNIFEEFHQVSTGLDRTHQGTGLGLTIASHLVLAMGGSIEVHSAPGAGSRFVVQLPRNLPQGVEVASPVPMVDTEPVVETEPEVMRSILLVEDSPESVKLAEALLRPRYNVIRATNIFQARQSLAQVLPDLILMDINLGEFTTGLDLTRELKRDARTASIPVVAVTAFAGQTDRQTALDAGCVDYLTKPFTSQQLYKVLEKNLQPVGSAR
ncbi:MAG: PAS domain S-box protein [Bacteroidota bacterium]|nr:PAS domain S-box protein [Bacteroidota bacterium]MDP4233674.1 PAS domain S-box protein [Bacteroidota bacterium]MDP4241869.1 PAS domain S-box protein [Bacteroidota bacterium]MDP4288943.1 PAS domain S-box protein [Bacteroidota bacterium]